MGIYCMIEGWIGAMRRVRRSITVSAENEIKVGNARTSTTHHIISPASPNRLYHSSPRSLKFLTHLCTSDMTLSTPSSRVRQANLRLAPFDVTGATPPLGKSKN
jgi:hypothetical protein